jgi:hypothetical protein
MRTGRLIVAVVLGLVGLVWVGQGLGLIGGSPMTDEPFWAWAGAALLVIAAVVAWSNRRS